MSEMLRLRPLSDACLVYMTLRDTSKKRSSTIITLDAPPEGRVAVARGKLVTIAEGRRVHATGQRVPSLADLGWRAGDDIYFLEQFKLFDARSYGGGRYLLLVRDFDILARVGCDGELEPSWGRCVVQQERASHLKFVGGMLLHTPERKSQNAEVGVGRVLRVAPLLQETSEADPSRPSGHAGERVTTCYAGVAADLGFDVGDRIVYRNSGTLTIVDDHGSEYVVPNCRDVQARVEEGATVQL